MPKKYTHRCIKDTLYFTTGPHQGREPDGSFPAETLVFLAGSWIGGYPQVQSETGILAYVHQDDIEELKA